MNQYICRVCKGNECTVLTSQVPPNCGCLHNSDIGALWEQDSSYQSEREKVLNIVADIINNRITYLREEKPEYFIRHRERGNFNELQATEGEFLLLRIREELRQKAGEQCGDNCKGECSGEVTGTPFCPQSERDTVLERLHIWFENYCEGNEDPDLWVAFLHAERTLRQQQGDPR